jgi:hypothetical protein
MKNKKIIRSGAICMSILFFSFFLFFNTDAEAKEVSPVKGAKFDVSISVQDNLKLYINKDVVVHFSSGKTMQGYVKSVGEHFVHLEKLAGRDFYDALVRITDIIAIEVKFRDIK